MKEMLYEVRYLKSSEDMILALTGQFKQLSSKCEDHIFTWLSYCLIVGICSSGVSIPLSLLLLLGFICIASLTLHVYQ